MDFVNYWQATDGTLFEDYWDAVNYQQALDEEYEIIQECRKNAGPDGICAAGGIAAFIALCRLAVMLFVGLCLLIDKWTWINRRYKELHSRPPSQYRYGAHLCEKGDGIRERYVQQGNKLVPYKPPEKNPLACKIFDVGTGERGRWCIKGGKIVKES